MENIIRKFEWESKWLKGEEYFHMLKHIDGYCETFAMQKFQKKSHPVDIYLAPVNGLIYFIQGDSIETDFGFPRVDVKKTYKWKKMNFTTDLPKKNPMVKYLVASANKLKEKGKPNFRMHAVALNEPSEMPYILCHIRQLHQETSESLMKKVKREALSPMRNGIFFLLDAAKNVISPVKDINKENDYVKLFKDSKVDKFPALSSHFKALFVLSKANN